MFRPACLGCAQCAGSRPCQDLTHLRGTGWVQRLSSESRPNAAPCLASRGWGCLHSGFPLCLIGFSKLGK